MRKSNLAVVAHAGPVSSGKLSAPHALSALAALGQSTRLNIFRLLMRHEPDGLLAGAIAEKIGCPHNTLSSHLAILARAGLISAERDGRTIMYRADVEGMKGLMSFLVKDCCGEHPELCDFSSKASSDCCDAASARKKKRR